MGKRALVLGVPLVAACFLVLARPAVASGPAEPLVRLAELEIYPEQIAAYTAALREEIEASLRNEPGVLCLYAVAVKDHPEQIRLFEVYRGTAAYQAHLQSPHFRKYKEQTQAMVKSLRLIETDPILLGARSR